MKYNKIGLKKLDNIDQCTLRSNMQKKVKEKVMQETADVKKIMEMNIKYLEMTQKLNDLIELSEKQEATIKFQQTDLNDMLNHLTEQGAILENRKLDLDDALFEIEKKDD